MIIMKKAVYSIADFSFAVTAEEGIAMKRLQPFSDFETEQTEQFTFFVKKGLPPPQKAGVLCYSDQRNQIYKSDTGYQRYIGSFHAASDWNRATTCLCFSENKPNFSEVFFKEYQREISEQELFNALGLENNLLQNGKAILHSSYITYKNKGILFTGPSGTGKSTQASLWKKNFAADVEIVNGDRSVIGESDEGAMAYGIPFCGSSKISQNKSAPLKGIVILRQGKQNRISKMDQKTAIKLLFSECSVNLWDPSSVEQLLAILEKITKQIPVWYFSCLPNSSAVNVLHEAMQQGETK